MTRVNASKTVTDATTDLDDEADNISDGLVSRTGSLTGYDTKDTATATLKAAFNHSIIATLVPPQPQMPWRRVRFRPRSRL